MDTVEGFTPDNAMWFHYDMGNDVLYLRLAAHREQEAFGEETPDGLILLRDDVGAPVGMTIVNYWQRFGQGQVQEVSFRRLQTTIAARALTLAQAV